MSVSNHRMASNWVESAKKPQSSHRRCAGGREKWSFYHVQFINGTNKVASREANVGIMINK